VHLVPAQSLLDRKRFFDDGGILQIRLWLLPASVPGSTHRFKYSLFYGYKGRRVIGYDNERGKGDHRHRYDVEEPYLFTTIDQLLRDFEADVELARS
jgi:hypothetical protein